MKRLSAGILAVALLVLAAGGARAQQQTQEPAGPGVGDVAPDFEIPGATRYGLLSDPVRLSDYRGQTVVLAFFFQARTRG